MLRPSTLATSVAPLTVAAQLSTTCASSVRGSDTGSDTPLPTVVSTRSMVLGAQAAACGRFRCAAMLAAGVTTSNASISCAAPEENVAVTLPR